MAETLSEGAGEGRVVRDDQRLTCGGSQDRTRTRHEISERTWITCFKKMTNFIKPKAQIPRETENYASHAVLGL